MFEKRLKILLIALIVVLCALAFRAGQIQIAQHGDWSDRAKASLKRQQLTETVRGTIHDVKGRPIAQDVACIDACVDYRVIPEEPDAAYVRAEARRRLREQLEGKTRPERTALIDAEVERVRSDIAMMWDLLGRMPGSTPQRVAETRQAIIQKVERRRRDVWYRSYEAALQRHQSSEKPPWLKRFLMGDDADAPKLEQFEVEVGEQVSPHPILKNIPGEVNNYLAKNLDRFPGLVLRPGITRAYPYGDVGAHLVGHLNKVSREDLEKDPESDELRQYLPFDLIGRGGLEELLEPTLRGRRGKVVRLAGASDVVESTEPVTGGNARTTIDIELQAKIQSLFAKARYEVEPGVFEVSPMHGAAVVIDVPTGEVRALASYPSFDPNTLEVNFQKLLDDEINLPLINRATSSMLEPGSTIKPMIGLAAITGGFVGLGEAITCHGYLVLGGKQYSVGRCWTMTRNQSDHRFVPWDEGHPTGNLNFVDAIQRSCNIFFETCGDRMGLANLSDWMLRFGLGKVTGLGITEARGSIPSSRAVPAVAAKSTSWFAGIGQVSVRATPIQMANVAATIARDGIMLRPRLIPVGEPLPAALASDGIPDRTDLNLNPAAVRLARQGMVKVVNTKAGSGTALKRTDMLVAGKTGTAQAAPFTYRLRDAEGNLVKDASGRTMREELKLSTRGNPNPQAPWYRGSGKSGTDIAHAWFIGYAPAENPKIAFCVLVEYGGGGGSAAAPIARDIVEACVEAGYLGDSAKSNTPASKQQPENGAPVGDAGTRALPQGSALAGELLRDVR